MTSQHVQTFDNVQVQIFSDRQSMGAASAQDVAALMKTLLSESEQIRMIFAAAPSQQEFLAALIGMPGVEWERVIAFHMDEYIGLPAGSPQSFGVWLQERLFRSVPLAQVHLLDGNSPDIEVECRRYSELLQEAPIDIVCLGIGENGHIAFNDPPVADFDDPVLVKVVELDQACRQQQVNDGCFASLDLVPRQAVTLTVPALMGARHLHCVVPSQTKAAAVNRALLGPIATDCPASVMRRHPSVRLYLDRDSANLLPR